MKKVLFALSLALAFVPVAAMADDPQAPAPPTQAQREQMFQTMETFHAKIEQMHQQMRTQLLSSLSLAHKQAVANVIGQLAIAPNPDPRAAAKQLDAILSGSEQQRILALHQSFRAQAKALHEQMRAEMEKQMPAFAGGDKPHQMMTMRRPDEANEANDAGSVLLKMLSHGGGMEMENHVFINGPPHP